jgi:hypothetical protein
MSTTVSFVNQLITAHIHKKGNTNEINGWQGSPLLEPFDQAKISSSTRSHSSRGNLLVKQRYHRSIRVVCREDDCPFDAYVSYDRKEGTYILRHYHGKHSCIGVQQRPRGSINTSALIEAKVSHTYHTPLPIC